MKNNIFFILFILNMIYSCKGQENNCKDSFDLNSISFTGENNMNINNLFNLKPNFYGIIFGKNGEWSIDKNDIYGYIYEKKDSVMCIYFSNKKFIANEKYTIYANLDKEIYAYSMQGKGIDDIENNVKEYIKDNSKYLSNDLDEYESKKLYKNFPGTEIIHKFDFPNKIVIINYINSPYYANNIIIRTITKNKLNKESYNIIKQEYEMYIQ